MLHFAPEPVLSEKFREIVGKGYMSADIDRSDVTERMDITKIPHKDATFDRVYCSHVLEHVDNDRLAMQELHRVLKPAGWGIISVPILRDRTLESDSILSITDRIRLYGQEDHVRAYGLDFVDRLIDAGFLVEAISWEDLVSKSMAAKFGVENNAGWIFFCKKQ